MVTHEWFQLVTLVFWFKIQGWNIIIRPAAVWPLDQVDAELKKSELSSRFVAACTKYRPSLPWVFDAVPQQVGSQSVMGVVWYAMKIDLYWPADLMSVAAICIRPQNPPAVPARWNCCECRMAASLGGLTALNGRRFTMGWELFDFV